MFGIIGAAVLTAAAVLIIKPKNAELAMILSVAAGTVLLIAILGNAAQIFSEINGILESSGVNTKYFAAALKALGICYISQLAADICYDFGQTALSKKIELAGKVMIVVLSLPLVKGILEIALRLMK